MNLNRRARSHGELELTIPMVYLEAKKRTLEYERYQQNNCINLILQNVDLTCKGLIVIRPLNMYLAVKVLVGENSSHERNLVMLMRRLGQSDMKISAMGLGCLSIGGPWTHYGQYFHNGEVDDAVSIRAIHRALDLGINFFDTAANYGAGHSKRILGLAVAGCRDKVVIATKFGYAVNEEIQCVRYYGDDPNSDQFANNLQRDCEASLRRLVTDYIDLYLFHIGDYPPEGVFQVRDALEKLVDAG